MELIASSKDDKKMYDQDSKDLRTQLQLIQLELSRNSQVPRSFEGRLDNLKSEIANSRMVGQSKADERREEAEEMIQTNMAVNKQKATPAAAPKREKNECEIYVCQTRDDHDTIVKDYSNDVDSLVALTELTEEQREALENLDLSGSKEEIAATLSKVPGLTRNQVKLLVDVATSLAV
jgi:peroxiredoxin family protein